MNHTREGKVPAASQAHIRTSAIRRVPAAGSHVHAPKVLRIGIIQNGRIIEEKIIRERDSVTIGLFEKNTFIIPSPLLPGKLVLFELKADRYTLNIRDYMEGGISSSRGVEKLSALRGVKRVPLDEKSKGRIIIGETTLLFQFVVPPPVQPHPQLPANMRGGWFKSFLAERFFNSLIGVSLVVHIVPVLYLVLRDWPVQEQGFDLDNKYIRTILLPPDENLLKEMIGENVAKGDGEEAVSEEESDAVKDIESPAKAAKKHKKVLTAEEKAALEAQRRAKLEATVSSSGILAPIGSLRDGAVGAAGADLLAVGGVDSDIDDVMKSVSGTRMAATGDEHSSLRNLAAGAGGGKVADITAIKVAKADADLETGSAKETKVKGKAKAGKGEEVGGSGILSASEVTRKVRERITAIQMCYQKGLNKNYGLEGKINVRFTIGTSGRVTKAKVVSDTLGDPGVASCVIDKVKTFVFSEPEGGPVEFVFPFVFKPAG